MKDDLIKSISRLPENVGKPIEAEEKLNIDFKGMVSQVTVLVRLPDLSMVLELKGEYKRTLQIALVGEVIRSMSCLDCTLSRSKLAPKTPALQHWSTRKLS